MDFNPIRYLSICSGAGGLDQGFRMAFRDAVTACYIEDEAYACEILAKRMEEGFLDSAPVWAGLQSFDGKPWNGKVDAVIGSIPQEAFANNRRESSDENVGLLWSTISRIITEIKPYLCFFEFSDTENTNAFIQIQDFFRNANYTFEYGIFSAEEIGCSQDGKKFFILAQCSHTTDEMAGSKFIKKTREDRKQNISYSRILSDPDPQGRKIYLESKNKKALSVSGERKEYQFHESGGGSLLVDEQEVPLFPPPPDDVLSWENICKQQPSLEPIIFGMADEFADKMDGCEFERRGQELLLLGKGILPTTTALAASVLLIRLANRTRST